MAKRAPISSLAALSASATIIRRGSSVRLAVAKLGALAAGEGLAIAFTIAAMPSVFVRANLGRQSLG